MFSNYVKTSLSQLLCIATFFNWVSIFFEGISIYSVSDSNYGYGFLYIETYVLSIFFDISINYYLNRLKVDLKLNSSISSITFDCFTFF